MPLHIDYRPKDLNEVAGNRSVIDSLESILRRPQGRPHAYLFTGPSGCGKTTLGRIVASRLGCAAADLREIDSADFRGIDSIRDIRQQARLKPMAGNVRVWLLDEVHKLTNDAQNALLKILEDTPAHVYFILCTTDPEKLLKTIKSRCTPFTVSALSERQMTRYLKGVVDAERDATEEDFPEEAYKLIHESSQGHVRAAMVMLDKIIGLPANRIAKTIEQASTTESQIIDLCRLLLKKAPWKQIGMSLKSINESQEPESVRHAVLGYMNSVLLGSADIQAAVVIEAFKEPFFNSGKAGLTLACFDSVVDAPDEVPF